MAALDFLFQGSPPPNVTSTGGSTTAMPIWYQQYMQGLMSGANSIASQPYTPYSGPLVAPTSPLQNKSFDAANTMGGTTSPLLQASGNLGTAAANGQTPNFDPEQLQKFINPYMSNVTDLSSALAQRQFTDYTLPSITNQFGGLGQGSTREMALVGQAGRDFGMNNQLATGNLLAQGFQPAMQNYQTFQGLGLQGANSAGALGIANLNAMNSLGGQQQQQVQNNFNAAQGQFNEQRQWPQTQASWLQSIVQGLPAPGSSTQSSQTGPYNGNAMSPSIASQGLGLGILGSAMGVFAEGGSVESPLACVAKARGGSVAKSAKPIVASSPLKMAALKPPKVSSATPSPLRLIRRAAPILGEV